MILLTLTLFNSVLQRTKYVYGQWNDIVALLSLRIRQMFQDESKQQHQLVLALHRISHICCLHTFPPKFSNTRITLCQDGDVNCLQLDKAYRLYGFAWQTRPLRALSKFWLAINQS